MTLFNKIVQIKKAGVQDIRYYGWDSKSCLGLHRPGGAFYLAWCGVSICSVRWYPVCGWDP